MPQLAPLQPTDHDDWLPLWRGYLDFYEQALADEITADVFARLSAADGDLHGVLARDDQGRAVGFVHWLTHPSTWTKGSYCYLEDLFVAPDGRGSGTGRALIEHVTGWATEQGCEKVYWITAETNTRARALYDAIATLTGTVQYEIPVRRPTD
jgi:GNAT superfamily N-acetyltransferase